MSNPPILPALLRKRAGLTFQLPPVPQFYRTGNAQASHPTCAPMPLMKHAAVIGLADVGGVCSIAGSPHALLLGKKDAKEENKPSFASLQRKEPLRLCTGIVALFDIIVSVDRSRLRDRDDDILPKGSSMMTLIQI